MQKHGDTRVHHVCDSCGDDVVEMWHEINGGYWVRTHHNCIANLRSQIKRLESTLEQLTAKVWG
jgi:ubiquinone biosynthesis protein UbiJ